MKPAEVFLTIAKDELQTLVDYQRMIDESQLSFEEETAIHEIMSDEFNHALIAMVYAKDILDIKIGEDHIEPDPNTIEVEEGGE